MKKMCDIVGIYTDEVRLREGQSGGAQYIMKNVDYAFFHKVEKDSEKLFKEITELNNKVLEQTGFTISFEEKAIEKYFKSEPSKLDSGTS